jgi:hypothetical protein
VQGRQCFFLLEKDDDDDDDVVVVLGKASQTATSTNDDLSNGDKIAATPNADVSTTTPLSPALSPPSHSTPRSWKGHARTRTADAPQR